MKNCILACTAALLIHTVASDYDPALSHRLFHFTCGAYCQTSSLTTWQCGPACLNEPGVKNVTLISDYLEGVFGYIAYQNNDIILTFRGSFNYANYIYDADFFMTPYPSVEGAEVHAGFLASYLGIQDQVVELSNKYIAYYPTA
jgi:hypothetical protein